MSDHILVVDDNQDAANVLVQLLTTLGYSAEAAYDGREAIEIAAGLHPDLAFIDIAMPGLDGYATVQGIRNRGFKHAIFVALTGCVSDEDKQRAYQSGFDFHVAKPMSLETLKELLTLLDPSAEATLSERIHRLRAAANP
jgi:CheY-like chemotaxis protein